LFIVFRGFRANLIYLLDSRRSVPLRRTTLVRWRRTSDCAWRETTSRLSLFVFKM